MTAGSSKSEDKDIIIVAIDEQPIWGDGCRGAPQLVNLAVHSLCELSLYQNKKIAKFSCEHEIWLFLYFGTALSEDKVLFIPQ